MSKRLGTVRRLDLILFRKVGILPFVALTAVHREIRKSGLAELLHWLVAPTSRDPARSKVTGPREPRRRPAVSFRTPAVNLAYLMDYFYLAKGSIWRLFYGPVYDIYYK